MEENSGLIDMVERGRGSDFDGESRLDLIDFQSTGAVMAFSELTIGEKVGVGASGVVMKGNWRGTTVAVKRLNSMLSNEQARHFRDEIKLLIRLRHPQIIQFLGAAFHAPDWYVLTEFAERGSLDAALADEQRIGLPWYRRSAMARDAAAGMNFLHQSQIIHRDLKSANLLVTADMRVKIADFGLSRKFDTAVAMTLGPVGTPAWSAPELLQGEKYSTKIDVYSYGVCLWEIATRETPYQGMPSARVMMSVCNGMRPLIPLTVSKEWSSLISDCWHEAPRLRPSFDQVLLRLDKVQAAAAAHGPGGGVLTLMPAGAV